MKKKLSLYLLIVLMILSAAGTALANVAYLGPAGTYTEEATILFFGEQEPSTPYKTVPEAIAAVRAGSCQYAVVPIENTIGGPVYPYLDAATADPDLTVVGEINLPIRQTLLAVPGATLADIKTVLSHPQGIAQSKDWLQANLPQADVKSVSSTAAGAKQVATGGDKSVAAIAASRTANVYHLQILANDLQYTDTNVTRFWVVARKTGRVAGAQHSAIVVQGGANALPALLNDLAKKGFAIVSIHDRAAKTSLGQYKYIIELSGADASALAKILAKHHQSLESRIIGAFDIK